VATGGERRLREVEGKMGDAGKVVNNAKTVEPTIPVNTIGHRHVCVTSMASVNQEVDVVKKQVKLDGVDDCDLPNVLNDFYTRFKQYDFSDDISDLKKSFTSDCDIVVSQDSVTSLFKHIDVNKAPGPDGSEFNLLRRFSLAWHQTFDA
jgi:hypothetical protein